MCRVLLHIWSGNRRRRRRLVNDLFIPYVFYIKANELLACSFSLVDDSWLHSRKHSQIVSLQHSSSFGRILSRHSRFVSFFSTTLDLPSIPLLPLFIDCEHECEKSGKGSFAALWNSFSRLVVDEILLLWHRNE